MTLPMKNIILPLLLLPSLSIHAQQEVQLYTSSSKFSLSISAPRSWNVHEYFQYESATSKLFHNKLSEYDGEGYDSHAVVTAVHVENVNHENAKIMNIDSVVSVTFSEVGLKGALVRGLDEEPDDVTDVLSKTVTNVDMMNLLLDIGLADATSIADVTFAPFTGSINERGVYSTDTDLVSKRKNSSWPMFFAGVMITLILCGISALGLFTYLNENGTWMKRQQSNKSVHAEGDVDVENATTASGVLGLKGHHPEAEDKENAHPNQMRRSRKGQGAILSSLTMDTDDVTDFEDVQLTPCSLTPQSCVSAASRYPLGITSMRKLNNFMTPQRPKSDKLVMYDVDRFNDTPDSSAD
jgi:hypothetical protein